ncbi:DUF397 domain-containing protein [Actinomadura namibiensis]|uniref:DUF397 domain-containing protein n=1 Tax=Actinomadura kijaniata TaxID=46161 RepID=UPI001C7241D8|nr:DUF397 domain-containing protein [Actinomadura namibiensis]
MTPVWRKSSRSGGTYGGQSDCVEVACLVGNIGVRDSKSPDGPHLLLGPDGWRSFARRVKSGEHDLT